MSARKYQRKARLLEAIAKTPLPIYGNYCGPNYGSGVPIDSVDEACQEHDDGYERGEYLDADLKFVERLGQERGFMAATIGGFFGNVMIPARKAGVLSKGTSRRTNKGTTMAEPFGPSPSRPSPGTYLSVYSERVDFSATQGSGTYIGKDGKEYIDPFSSTVLATRGTNSIFSGKVGMLPYQGTGTDADGTRAWIIPRNSRRMYRIRIKCINFSGTTGAQSMYAAGVWAPDTIPGFTCTTTLTEPQYSYGSGLDSYVQDSKYWLTATYDMNWDFEILADITCGNAGGYIIPYIYRPLPNSSSPYNTASHAFFTIEAIGPIAGPSFF